MKVAKWGNSLAVRLPAGTVEALSLKEGDEIIVRPAGEGVVEILREPGRDELIAQLRVYRGSMPANFKFDRDEANER
jgi:antitoxin MazE